MAVSLAGILLVALHLTLPYGMTFKELPGLILRRLPWGELIRAPRAKPGQLLFLATLFTLLYVLFTLLYVLYALHSILALWRSGERKRSKALLLGWAPLLLIGWPNTFLITWGILPPPSFASFTYVVLITIMSLQLVDEAVRAAALARTTETNERRWRALLENVRMPVLGCRMDGTIEYANPFCFHLSGYVREELIGRRFEMLAPEKDAARIAALIQRAGEGETVGYAKIRLRATDGHTRSTVWSTVLLRDKNGTASAILGIGSDITEQDKAEAARADAMSQLQLLKAQLEAENLYLKEEISATESHAMIGQSTAIKDVLEEIRQVAKTNTTVLIEGETGVGKELVARAVHRESARSQAPFIRVNCAALAPALMESELFGHEKGSFTGADRTRKGRFELAEGGTLFLDEIGELSLETQAKLLRILQEGEYERVGDSRARRADVRIIAATNRNLKGEVASGRFREDLFYRLNVYPITVPPLRERREDIPLLVDHLTRQSARRHRKQIDEVPGRVLSTLSNSDWPGNIRELANVIERAVILSRGRTLMLPADSANETANETHEQAFEPRENVERRYILRILMKTGWKISGPGGAAEILGLNANTLRSRMERIGISRGAEIPERSSHVST